MGKINLSNPSLTQRPEIGGVRVEPLGDKRYILRKEGQGAESKGPDKGQAKGTEKVAPKKPSGNAPPASTNPPKERQIRKKKEPSASASIERGPIRSLGKDSSGLSRRNSFGYPASPEIDLKKYGAPSEGERSGSFINRIYNYITGGSSSYRSPSNRGTSSSGSISSSLRLQGVFFGKLSRLLLGPVELFGIENLGVGKKEINSVPSKMGLLGVISPFNQPINFLEIICPFWFLSRNPSGIRHLFGSG